MWVYQFGTEQPERGYGVLAGANREVYLTGSRGSYPGAVYLTQLAVPGPGAVLSGAAIALAALARRRQRRA